MAAVNFFTSPLKSLTLLHPSLIFLYHIPPPISVLIPSHRTSVFSSPRPILLPSVSSHLTSSLSISPHLVSSLSISPHLTSSLSISPHLVSSLSISPHLVSSLSISPRLTSSSFISPYFTPSPSISPHLAFFHLTSPHLISFHLHLLQRPCVTCTIIRHSNPLPCHCTTGNS